ncbi:MAG TPA: NADH-ubiquinone oxidoreductase-F iron-sulfur binding region domain-containing protein [Streptosporangiaceae bacterium]
MSAELVRRAPAAAARPAVPLYRPPQARLPRLLAGMSYHQPTDLREHERRYGPIPLRGHSGRERPERLIDVVDRSGLTGRGGAGFPTGRKMRSVATGRGPATVVANGAEGEPASCKDRLLLTRLPHLVMDGISLAADAVGAREAFLCVHRQETDLLATLADAAEARRRAGMDPVPVQIVGIPGRYVSSEQSSIVQFINGGPAKPTFAPPRPHERGVAGRPTLENNVETLAHLALIARYGDNWFRGVGLPSATGSALVTVGGTVARPGVYEIELGTPIGQVIMQAGGPTERPQALLVGGYFGTWIPAEYAWQIPLAQPTLRAAGGAMGAGIVIALPVTSCGLAETARVVRYLAEESAGQCGPCVMGLPALADALADLAYQGGRGRALDQISRLLPVIEGRGACRHPDGATKLVRSALRTFSAEVQWHDQRGACYGVRRDPLLPVPGDEEREWGWK